MADRADRRSCQSLAWAWGACADMAKEIRAGIFSAHDLDDLNTPGMQPAVCNMLQYVSMKRESVCASRSFDTKYRHHYRWIGRIMYSSLTVVIDTSGYYAPTIPLPLP